MTIAAQASPHRTAALAALCQQLDARAAIFPGTNLRLRLAVSPRNRSLRPRGMSGVLNL